jgi:hypothetical protein
MKAIFILAASLTPCVWCAAQDADVEQLMAQKNQAVQEQIANVSASLHQPGGIDTRSNVEAFRELQNLKNLAPDQGELVKQIAIFAATDSDEEQQPLVAVVILGWLQLPPKITIRTLAPYLDTKNAQLHSFLYDIFRGLDNADSAEWGAVNYKEYLDYVRASVNRGEEIPAPFIKYIYERSPGRALLVFAKGTANVSAQLQAIRTGVEARQEGRELTEQERAEIAQVRAESQREGQERREIVLAEHIISHALWLKKHGFDEQFHEALPEAVEELKKLAKHDEWWAKLYVAYIMRQNLVLRHDHTLRQLAEDENEFVSQAAKAARGQ